MRYPNNPPKKVVLQEKYFQVARQLALGSPKSIASSLMKVEEIKVESLQVIFRSVTNEIQGLCAVSNPSLQNVQGRS